MTHVQSSILIETSHQRRKEEIWSVSNLSGRIIMTMESSMMFYKSLKNNKCLQLKGHSVPTDDDDQTN